MNNKIGMHITFPLSYLEKNGLYKNNYPAYENLGEKEVSKLVGCINRVEIF